MAEEIAKGGGTDVRFDYKEVDEETAEFLRKKETNMREIERKAATEFGKELKEAQDELAKAGYGCFTKWLAYIGVEQRKAYRLIDRYKLVLDNLSKTDLLEDLPVSLTYDIAKPSAESTPAKAQAKAEVLSGDITTGKAYKDRIKELEAMAETERKERERLEVENEELSDRLEEIPKAVEPEVRVETRTEYVEVKDEFSEKRAEEAEARLREYEERFGDIRNYDDKITASNRQDMIVAVGSFTRGVRDFAKRYAYIAQYTDVISNLGTPHKESYEESVRALRDLASNFYEGTEEVFIIEQ